MLNKIEPTKKKLIINKKETIEEEVLIKDIAIIDGKEVEITKKKLIPKDVVIQEELEFIFDLDAFLELERRYGAKALVIFNQMLMRVNITNNFTKILACACKTKEIDDAYLRKHLKINKQYLNVYSELTLDIMDGFIAENVSNVNEALDILDEEMETLKEDNKEEENKKKH